ncbi:MAG TPA: DUF4388 domain-containing protein [Vicinamibacteria bacterium]|jgi:hypothetical protein|nr:DUF4388 domain-containing protein [Vicinamibacteria bacterium]
MDLSEFEDDSSLTLHGRIEESSVPELLKSVLSSGETGVLTFTSGEITKSIFMHKGKVTYARSNNPDERLGECLLVRGKITARQYLEASKLIRPGRRLGVILIELEAIEAEELVPSLEQHVRDILLDVFTWSHGEYQLVMNQPGPEDVATLNMPWEGLVFEGIRRTRSWSRVWRALGDIDSAPLPTGNTEVLQKVELSDEEGDILAHVNGRATIDQICQASYLPHFETCRLLWAFQVLGLMRRGQAAEAAAQEEDRRELESDLDIEDVVERLNQMLSRVYAFLRGRLGEQVDELMTAALASTAGRYEALFYDVDLKQYGRADYDQMLANVADLPAAERRQLIVAGLKDLLGTVQARVRASRGSEEEAVVSGIIKDGLRRIGAA